MDPIWTFVAQIMDNLVSKGQFQVAHYSFFASKIQNFQRQNWAQSSTQKLLGLFLAFHKKKRTTQSNIQSSRYGLISGRRSSCPACWKNSGLFLETNLMHQDVQFRSSVLHESCRVFSQLFNNTKSSYLHIYNSRYLQNTE